MARLGDHDHPASVAIVSVMQVQFKGFAGLLNARRSVDVITPRMTFSVLELSAILLLPIKDARSLDDSCALLESGGVLG